MYLSAKISEEDIDMPLKEALGYIEGGAYSIPTN
jgi:hypothetical protein